MISVNSVYAQSIVNSKHNLSVSGTGSYTASTESEICIFCHTPHNSAPVSPLWNRQDPGAVYTIYSSSTIDAAVGQLDGASLMCLSCHDGTIALGNVVSRTSDIIMSGGITTLPPGSSNLSTDLSDDHPVSFIYNSALAVSDGELADPSALTGPVTVRNSKMQCISCHDPHSDAIPDFLNATNQNSVLCNYCHTRSGWSSATHNTSTAVWNGSGVNPWHTTYTTVSENACENCHTPHTAADPERLMNFSTEEANCLNCHNGNVSSIDIETGLTKLYTHPVANYDGVHDPAEGGFPPSAHIECADCHDPHSAASNTATAPAVMDVMGNLIGIDTDGNMVEPAQYQYEVCYRCHSDFPVTSSPTPRQFPLNSVRTEFDPANPSYHPIEAAGKYGSIQSLLAPYNASSIIYCTDCHGNSDEAVGGPAGPHGSVEPHILKATYMTFQTSGSSNMSNSPETDYGLCFQCHDYKTYRDIHKILRNSHWRKSHCNTCHDPHASSGSTHLINFDTDVVSPNNNGDLNFIDYGYQTGECNLKCHNRNHLNSQYPK